MAKKSKIALDGSTDFGNRAFAELNMTGLAHAPTADSLQSSTPQPAKVKPATKPRGRVDVGREKSGRGGKWVTVARGTGFQQTAPQELDQWLKRWKSQLGCGGTRNGKTLEIQGDQRSFIADALQQLGYQVVFVGG